MNSKQSPSIHLDSRQLSDAAFRNRRKESLVPCIRDTSSRIACWCWLCLLTTALGCNSFGNGKLAKQLQSENDQLVREFRAQRDRNAELTRANQLLEDRIAETEKQLARNFQADNGRLSRLNSLPSSKGTSSSGYASQAWRTEATNVSPYVDESGLRWEPR